MNTSILAIAAAATLTTLLPAQGPARSASGPSQDKQQAPAKAPDVYSMRPEARGEFTHANIANTTEALRQVEAHLRKLPKAEIAKLRKVVRETIAECPYTHSTFYLLRTAEEVSRAFPTTARGKGPLAIRDRRLATVRGALALQWRICELLKVPDALAQVDVDKVLASVKSKQPKLDPQVFCDEKLLKAARLLATVKPRVDALSAAKKKNIFGQHDVLGPATAGLWNFKSILIRCASELRLATGDNACRKDVSFEVKFEEDRLTRLARALTAAFERQFILYC